MGAAGVCHSDVHVISGQAQQLMPCVLGHEGAGRVTSIGDEVSRVSIGDHVILSWLRIAKIAISVSVARHIYAKLFKHPLATGHYLMARAGFLTKGLFDSGSLGCWSENVVVSEECCVP